MADFMTWGDVWKLLVLILGGLCIFLILVWLWAKLLWADIRKIEDKAPR